MACCNGHDVCYQTCGLDHAECAPAPGALRCSTADLALPWRVACWRNVVHTACAVEQSTSCRSCARWPACSVAQSERRLAIRCEGLFGRCMAEVCGAQPSPADFAACTRQVRTYDVEQAL